MSGNAKREAARIADFGPMDVAKAMDGDRVAYYAFGQMLERIAKGEKARPDTIRRLLEEHRWESDWDS